MKKTLAILSALAAAALLTAYARAAVPVLAVEGRNLWTQAGTQMVGDTTYVSLRTMAQELAPEAEVSWRGGSAWVEGEGLSLRAKPGELYITVNQRAFYVPQGVRQADGRVLLPVRVIARALGAEVTWSAEKGVTVKRGRGVPGERPYSDEDLEWMARIISAESRGEPLAGKLAVGTVVLNRVAAEEFPNSIKAVIFDREWGIQFEPVANGTVWLEPTQESVLAARLVLDGARVAGDSLYFLAPDLTQNHWIMENREYVTAIGSHWFYR